MSNTQFLTSPVPYEEAHTAEKPEKVKITIVTAPNNAIDMNRNVVWKVWSTARTIMMWRLRISHLTHLTISITSPEFSIKCQTVGGITGLLVFQAKRTLGQWRTLIWSTRNSLPLSQEAFIHVMI